jgi:hypothetical protein
MAVLTPPTSQQRSTLQVTSSHLDRLAVTFDSPTLVSNAGLLLPAVLPGVWA